MPGSASGSSGTPPGSAHGAPAFMSPEQARGDLERPGRRRIFIVWVPFCTSFRSGSRRFWGANWAKCTYGYRGGEFAQPRQVDAATDPALESVGPKTMAVKSEDRDSSSRAPAEDVERWMSDVPVTSWREPFGRRARRRAKRAARGAAGC